VSEIVLSPKISLMLYGHLEKIADFPNFIVAFEILSSTYQPYACGKSPNAP